MINSERKSTSTHYVSYWYVPGGCDYSNAFTVKEYYDSEAEALERAAEIGEEPPEMAIVVPCSETKPRKRWLGDVPTKCDVTGVPITDTFIDGRTVMGPWACMHPDAHRNYGCGLGIGSGQRYVREQDADGNVHWYKDAG